MFNNNTYYIVVALTNSEKEIWLFANDEEGYVLGSGDTNYTRNHAYRYADLKSATKIMDKFNSMFSYEFKTMWMVPYDD